MSEAGWRMLSAVSKSGKTLYVCLHCGRISQTPDKTCKGVMSDWWRPGFLVVTDGPMFPCGARRRRDDE